MTGSGERGEKGVGHLSTHVLDLVAKAPTRQGVSGQRSGELPMRCISLRYWVIPDKRVAPGVKEPVEQPQSRLKHNDAKIFRFTMRQEYHIGVTP